MEVVLKRLRIHMCKVWCQYRLGFILGRRYSTVAVSISELLIYLQAASVSKEMQCPVLNELRLLSN